MNRLHHRNEQGFSLIEAIVAILILGVALSAIVPSFIFQAETTRQNELRTGAVAAAQQTLDSLRQQDFADWPAKGSDLTVATGLRDYTVTINWCETGVDTFCGDGSRQARATVSFQGEELYSVETVYTTFE